MSLSTNEHIRSLPYHVPFLSLNLHRHSEHSRFSPFLLLKAEATIQSYSTPFFKTKKKVTAHGSAERSETVTFV